jgi:iron complex transport system permease protein
MSMPAAARLNIMMLGEESAQGLGVHVQRLKVFLLILTALLTGASVAVAGLIGFIGLIVPHVLRLFTGPDNRWLIPAAFLGGGFLLVIMDLLSRTLPGKGGELPPGVLTALVGAPFFAWLLILNRKRTEVL